MQVNRSIQTAGKGFVFSYQAYFRKFRMPWLKDRLPDCLIFKPMVCNSCFWYCCPWVDPDTVQGIAILWLS